MTVSAHDVAAELRHRLPGLGNTKLHKLLYYCQGVHLAHTGQPLFSEAISAWDRGPVVDALWSDEAAGNPPPPRATLGNAELGTIGKVVSSYGKLSGTDLSRLTKGEDPWIKGNAERQSSDSGHTEIRVEWIREYFAQAVRAVDDDEAEPDPVALRQWLAEVASQPAPPAGPPATRENLAAWARRGA